MRKQLLIGAAAVSLLGALGAAGAGAAPSPKYTVTCTVGGNTTAKWQRVTLSHITFEWFAPAGSTVVFTSADGPVQSTRRHGLAFLDTPPASAGVAPATVTVTFQHADGSGSDQVTEPCT
jgi:hypothetical protein